METFDPKRRFVGLYIPNCLAESPLFNWSHKALWGRLVQYANDDGVAWPKVTTLARDLAMSKRQIVRLINELDGVLLEVERPDGLSRLSHRSNRYRFLYHSVFETADSPRCQIVTSGSDTHGTSGGDNMAPPQDKDHSDKKESPSGIAPPASPLEISPGVWPPYARAVDSAYMPDVSNIHDLDYEIANMPDDANIHHLDYEVAKWMWEWYRTRFRHDEQPVIPVFSVWANSVYMMRHRDKRTYLKMSTLWKWVVHHHYWHYKIRTPGALRKQWDGLVLERKTKSSPPSEFGINVEGGGKYGSVKTTTC